MGTRKAAPRKKSASARGKAVASAAAASSKAAASAAAMADGEGHDVEVDDEGNVIDPLEERYCLCNRVSFGTMIQCDNVDVSLPPSLSLCHWLLLVGVGVVEWAVC